MSGHSKWHSIRHKKGANDAARGKIFTKHANLITIAARSGGDPESNPALRLAIDNAKKENTPNKNIERAIKKGTGEDKTALALIEATFEGYGPNGIAILVETLSDNRNRIVSGVRVGFSKNNGNMGENGSVSWMFHRKGVISIQIENNKIEEIEMIAIENDAEDVIYEISETEKTTEIEIICDSKDVFQLQKTLQNECTSKINAKISMVAENTVAITTLEDAKKLFTLIEALEDTDDVIAVHSNADITSEIMEQIMQDS
ncbi:TPA: YebC/PmpR family DNA-binding transcriptional regulator [Candidatus Gracilibacteria bacterium]|nr:YebC/PmpR family DNA-binding transcriptional regulator [Candidatus Peregrinibacteria bacterium]HIQ56555.1 YebC/PmpR family DNA-binding transcriptional regulator [Candidatus Gracilibacteria bacterium]HIQ57577.1 YebC/PmpR family DNA-binding transcriptional regulator [Candidatus Gracilibacteria bacterium]